MRVRPILGAAAVLAVLCGCSGSPHQVAAAVKLRALPTGCRAALAALPPAPPETGNEASADQNALEAVPKGTAATILAYQAAVAVGLVALDLDGGYPIQGDLQGWDKAAAALRSYCS